MRIAHLSDLHFGAEIPSAVDALVERLWEARPDVTVISGDFTMAAHHSEFEDAMRLLDDLTMPIVAVPGNHDMPVYNFIERFFSPFDRYKRAIRPYASDRYVSRAAAICGLNTARPWNFSLNWSHGRLSQEQIRAADDFFEVNAASKFKAVAVHHPFDVPDDMPGFRTIGNGDAMLEVLAKHRVDLVMSGHLHRQFVTRRVVESDHGPHTVHFLQTASPTTHRHREHPNAFALIDVLREGVVIHDQILDGGRFVPRSRELIAA